MGFLKYLALYGGTLVVFLGIDAVWLALMSRRFYSVQLAGLMAEKVQWLPAVLFYLLFVAAVIVLVVMPAVAAGSWVKALVTGALLGMVAYATYDLTNLSTIRNWPLAVTLVDIVWGTALSALTATASYFIAQWLK